MIQGRPGGFQSPGAEKGVSGGESGKEHLTAKVPTLARPTGGILLGKKGEGWC